MDIIFLNVNSFVYIKKRIMRFREFETQIRALPVFNLNDVRKIDPDFHRQQLTTWQNQDTIKPLVGGYYALSGRPVDEHYLFMLANKVYEPSYVSLESALSYYQVIPETVFGVTSISSRKTMSFQSDWGVFSYRSIQPGYLIGYQVVETSPAIKFKIASLEKAILDYLYLNSTVRSSADCETLRWNVTTLRQQLNPALMMTYTALFNKRALQNRVNQFLEYLNA
jgi:predicted transcriptional regulator of viral defense system